MTDPAQPSAVPCTGAHRSPRPFWRFVQWTGFVVAACLFLAGGMATSAIAMFLAALFAVGPGAIVYQARDRGAGEVQLGPTGLRWTGARGGELVVPTAQIVGGHLAHKFRAPLHAAEANARPGPRPLRSAVLDLENGSQCRLDFETREAAEQVMSHVGLDAGKRAVVAPLRGILGPFTRGLLAFVFSMPVITLAASVLFHAPMTGLCFLASIAFTALWVQRYGFPRVVVGADGIRLIGRLLPRFVSFAEVVDVRSRRQDHAYGSGVPYTGVEVVCRGGHTLLLPTIAQSSDEELALVNRIRAGMKAYAQGACDKVLWALQRRGRPITAWKEDLRRVAQSEGGFRDQAFGPEDFERVLLDPSAAADQRLGAALALHGKDPAAGPRIREAAATSANVRLRVALEAAAEGEVDEAALEGALQEQRR